MNAQPQQKATANDVKAVALDVNLVVSKGLNSLVDFVLGQMRRIAELEAALAAAQKALEEKKPTKKG